MELTFTPLTALRRHNPSIISRDRLSSTSSSLSSFPYPQIPTRRSSLSTNMEYDSSEHATSTRTPSLSDSLYNIDVVKIRGDRAAASRDIHKTGLDCEEDPFVDHTPQGRLHPRDARITRSGYRRAPQLLVRWSSGSYGDAEPCIQAESSSSSDAIDPPVASVSKRKLRMDSARILSGITHRSSSGLLCPLNPPITYATMRSYTGLPCFSSDSMSVWASVNVSADVEPIALPDDSSLAPIDMIILFDSLQQPSVSILTPMVLASSILASNLVPNRDRIAMACVDGRARNGFELLLPLGFHSFETSRSALNTFSFRQLKKRKVPCADAGNSIRQVSQLFYSSSRAAFCHLVFISAHPPEGLVISGLDTAIGVHTISPQLSFPIDTMNHPLGWHIFYDADSDDPRSSEVHFMRKVSKFVRQIRTGLCPGMITDLRLFIDQGPGCHFESAIGSCQLARLRPGETWILKMKVDVPVEFYQEAQLTEHPVLEDLIREINRVLKAYSTYPTAQDVLSGRLEYRHSLFPTQHDIFLETHCTISRTPVVPSEASEPHQENTRLVSYEMDDDTFSLSLGSASDSSSD
ncbi:uncharacterized protein N7515_007419 [Penicillium bovifimosum]|uniref:Uncharacterized protein n=1 Tax=Penicillium bovifimosum TaxID=126998 RepID=A0A9W9GWL4_9EURO|nr:uncharacterized protein N7515_007419 [Penicillium bovifimosum]KAJ5131380.1 hypothetical protein N7515_007419 [Penicillium bovifimosum]